MDNLSGRLKFSARQIENLPDLSDSPAAGPAQAGLLYFCLLQGLGRSPDLKPKQIPSNFGISPPKKTCQFHHTQNNTRTLARPVKWHENRGSVMKKQLWSRHTNFCKKKSHENLKFLLLGSLTCIKNINITWHLIPLFIPN